MMQVKNQSLLASIPFEDYISMPGWSHSSIKQIGKDIKIPTAKMHLGTNVHRYLLEPEKYDHVDQEIVKPVAIKLKQTIGPMYQYLIPEQVVTADFCYNDFTMPYKGRLDLSIMNQIVIDLKVSDMPLQKAIEYFDYDNQLSGYAISIGARVALIISISPTSVEKFLRGQLKQPLISVANIPIKDDWWRYQVLQKGIPNY